MNRYLSIPLVLTLVGFGFVYFSSSSYGEPIDSAAIASVNNAKATGNIKPIVFEDVKTLVLDGWPTLGVHHLASRMGPTQPLYASMGPVAQLGKDGKPDLEAEHYHCSLRLVARPKPTPKSNLKETPKVNLFARSYNNFAIHVDRYTREIMIFDNQWQDYSKWKETALPHYKQLTGWNAEEEKKAQSPNSLGALEPSNTQAILDLLKLEQAKSQN